MKESMCVAKTLAFNLLNNSEIITITKELEESKMQGIHIHVPEGATPKDGPSAGIAMLTALASAFTQKKIKSKLAMTGEITLRGVVLPVGGIKEKILAAKRSDIQEVILSQENRKDIEEINADYLKGMTFHYVSNMKEVLRLALLNEKVKNPIKIAVPKKEKLSSVVN
jgi:ATP-dependent Lon protease